MPTFSIIVPARGVEDYLDDCLRSIRDQPYQDYEVLAVSDGAPDTCGTIIEEHAKVDERVVPIHLWQTLGVGAARNVGIAASRGRYLLFLDGDDTFARGALEAMAAHLRNNGDPDIVLYDYAFHRPCGIGGASNLARWLPGKPPGARPFLLREKPFALRVAWTATNKIYRREFVNQMRLRFPSGYYEDAPWALMSLLAAGSISVLRRVCLYYRCCRPGSITMSSSARHADVFDQFDRIFAFLDRNPRFEFPALRPEIIRRMTLIMQHVGADQSMIPADMLDEFRRSCERYFFEHRPSGYDGPDLHWPPSPWAALADNGVFAKRVWGSDEQSAMLAGCHSSAS